MKTKYLFFGLAALLAAGCANEEFKLTPSTNGVRVFADMPSTRISFGEGDAITYATWQNGDVISLSTDLQSNLQYTANVAEEGSTVTEFQPSGDALQNNYNKVVYACYPSAVIDMENMTVPLPDTQNYNALEFRPFVYAIDTILSERLSLHFHHPYAYLKLTFTEGILPPDTISIGAVMVASDEVIAATNGKFNFSTQAVEVSGGSKTMLIERLGGNGSGHVLKGSPYTLYVPVLPQSEGTKITIKACYTVGSGLENCYPYYTMEKTVPTGGFQAGHVYTLTMDNANNPVERISGIYTLEDLIAFRDAKNAGGDLSKWKNSDGVINIFADIDLSSIDNWGEGIKSIEKGEVLDGNGYKLLNFIAKYADYSYFYYGFIGTNSGIIRNLTMGEGGVLSGGTVSGAFCSYNDGTISNCINYATVISNRDFGGICGTNWGLIEKCSNYSDLQGGDNIGYMGGIVGFVGYKGIVSDCHNYGSIESAVNAGGIVGESNGSIVECKNEGLVTSTGEYGAVGGVCGVSRAANIDDVAVVIDRCVNKAEVSGLYYTGGIIGVCETTFKLTDCHNSGNLFGYDGLTGGICGIISGSASMNVLTNNINTGTVNGITGDNANAIGKDNQSK